MPKVSVEKIIVVGESAKMAGGDITQRTKHVLNTVAKLAE
jgi:hypothetical protein